MLLVNMTTVVMVSCYKEQMKHRGKFMVCATKIICLYCNFIHTIHHSADTENMCKSHYLNDGFINNLDPFKQIWNH